MGQRAAGSQRTDPAGVEGVVNRVRALFPADRGKPERQPVLRGDRGDDVADPSDAGVGAAGATGGHDQRYLVLYGGGEQDMQVAADCLYRSEIRLGYAACEYSLISPLRIFLRRTRAEARSTRADPVSVASGGR